MKKVLVEQYTEKDFTFEEIVKILKNKMTEARKNKLVVEFIANKPIFNEQNEIIDTTTDFPTELNIYSYE